MQVAQTILQQLGGNRFRAMTGAKNFVGNENALTFKLPARMARNGINLVQITLTPADLYTVEFYKSHGIHCDIITRRENVYADNLQSTFKDVTGLDTHL